MHRADPLLPSGTVTFLFTDIEGSTRLWETQSDAMRAALARHDTLLRQCVESGGGHVFRTGGDAFCAAFHTAPDALAAALAGQQALVVERWPVRIRVRMALHTGAVELRDGDYIGAPLNRLARLLAAGHGGQTLLSEATYNLCRDHLPPQATVKPLGEHSLKDLLRRESVFQLCHPDLPQTFPPLKTLLIPTDADTPSIAVLPFVNMSRDEDNEYFADGLSEELLNVLSKIRGLRVTSRTSAFSFKGAKVDIPTVAQKLNVATVLEGSVRKSGKRVRITVQLIQVTTDSHLWAGTYNRELEDIFAVQDDIAQSVVKELRATLLGEKPDVSANAAVQAEVQAAAKGRGENPEAYRLYLQGRFYTDRMTREDAERAVEFFRQALTLTPEFALAWAGLAQVCRTQAWYGWAPVAQGFERAREAAQRALALAPDLAEGHIELGFVRATYDWDWKGADGSFRRAMELAPGNAEAVRAVAGLAGQFGRLDEAVALSRRAVTLDPLTLETHRFHSLCCLIAGRLEEAASAAQTALDLNPRTALTHGFLACIRLMQGRLEDGLALSNQEVHPVLRLWGIAMAQHKLGNSGESAAALEELIEQHADYAACQVAEICAFRGEIDGTFEWLERSYKQRDPGLAYASVNPLLRNLHADPRWQPFLQKMGFAG